MVRRLAILTAAAALIMTPPVYAGQWMEDGNAGGRMTTGVIRS